MQEFLPNIFRMSHQLSLRRMIEVSPLSMAFSIFFVEETSSGGQEPYLYVGQYSRFIAAM
jgi:hypothetical protein